MDERVDEGTCPAERGSVLLETAITITLLLAFVSGIIDLWKFCRDAETLLTASRHGARAAAATGHTVESGPTPAAACGYTGTTNRVLQVGVSLTNKYLVASGLDSGPCNQSGTTTRTCSGESFTVSSDFVTLCEDGFAQRAISVSVVPAKPRRCLFCFQSILPAVMINAKSVFAIEADCSKHGVVACP